MNRDEIDKEFFEGRRSDRMPFVVNDSVEITSGPKMGKLAAIISVKPDEIGLSYLVEPGDGSGDLVISAKHLRLI